MKNKLNFIVFCDNASQGENQKLNLNGVFTKIFTPSLPSVHSFAAIVSRFTVEKGEHTLEVMDHRNNKISELLFEAEEDNYVANHVVNYQNIVFEKAGKNTFSVLLDGKKIGSDAIEVIIEK